MKLVPATRLLADIGGTNARFAWQAGAGAAIEQVRIYACTDFPSPLEAALRYLADTGLGQPALGAIGIANPVDGDAVKMTNHHWSFSIEALRQALGLARLVVVNDFKALALSLPHLPASDLLPLGGGAPDPLGVKGLIGPGTGLGVGALVPDGQGGWLALDSEGGHTSVSPANDREWAVVKAMIARHGHCSFERLVTGMGLENLYATLRQLDGLPALEANAAQVSERALAGGDAHAAETLQMFLALLGSAAGNLALTVGARGGIYLGGGILPRLKAVLATSPLRERFEAKGRFAPWLRTLPMFLIDSQGLPPALRGAAAALGD